MADTPMESHASLTGVQREETAQPNQTNTGVEESDALGQVETRQRVRDAGWAEPVTSDYASYERNATNDASWLANATVYEWNDDFGDVGPAVPQLEAQLFNTESTIRQGEHIQGMVYEVDVAGPEKLQPVVRFEDAGLHPIVLQNIALCGWSTATAIQSYVIPAAMLGHDVIGISQTGSGKTAAYLVPAISKLMGKARSLRAPRPRPNEPSSRLYRAEPLIVVLVPTRELAIQIFDQARRLCYRSMLRPAMAYGGMPLRDNIDDLRKGCDILVATLGRLEDLMNRPDLISMSRVKWTIIDEADELLQGEWEERFNFVMSGGDANEDADHVYMMFSATFPRDMRRLARQYMGADHYSIRVGRPGQTHRNIDQQIIKVDGWRKNDAVHDLLLDLQPPGRTMIFCNAIFAVDRVDDFLFNKGFPTAALHSGRGQLEREDALKLFRSGQIPILIATGVTSRGLDISGVDYIINYDLPSVTYGGITEYVHRIGRTGRIGHRGKAFSFYDEARDSDIAQDLVNSLIEAGGEVPEFIAEYQPEEGGTLNFNDNSDDEEDGTAEAEGGWGGAATQTADDAHSTAAADGLDGFNVNDSGFQADGRGSAEITSALGAMSIAAW